MAPGVVFDIVAELAYWQSCYPYRQFFHSRLPFDSYVPTFKFGYDTFLLHHRVGLTAVWPRVELRYAKMHTRDRLEWKEASGIIKAAWQRMGAAELP